MKGHGVGHNGHGHALRLLAGLLVEDGSPAPQDSGRFHQHGLKATGGLEPPRFEDLGAASDAAFG